MDPRTELLCEIEAYIRAHPMAETTFGLRAVNDGKFMGRLRDRRNLTLDTIEKVRAYIRQDGSA